MWCLESSFLNATIWITLERRARFTILIVSFSNTNDRKKNRTTTWQWSLSMRGSTGSTIFSDKWATLPSHLFHDRWTWTTKTLGTRLVHVVASAHWFCALRDHRFGYKMVTFAQITNHSGYFEKQIWTLCYQKLTFQFWCVLVLLSSSEVCWRWDYCGMGLLRRSMEKIHLEIRRRKKGFKQTNIHSKVYFNWVWNFQNRLLGFCVKSFCGLIGWQNSRDFLD